MNCLKRTVVCLIMDVDGTVIGIGRNQCDPIHGGGGGSDQPRHCARMHIKAKEEGYDGAGCNSVHAEINAIADIRPGDYRVPYSSLLIGHDFCCGPCIDALLGIGIRPQNIIVWNPLKQHG